MKSPASASVCVIGDTFEEVGIVVADLKKHFKNVDGASPDHGATGVLERPEAEVIIVAFKDLDQAQPYCRTVSDGDRALSPQRSVLLCTAEDAPAAFELCKRQYFDDYVTYWPAPSDRLRLCMSVWLAARAAMALRQKGENDAELLVHAKQLGELDRKVAHELDMGERRAAVTHETMEDLERKLVKANDDFSEHLLKTGANSAVEVKDSEALKRELAQLRDHQVGLARTARGIGVEPMSNWARQLRAKVEPSLAAPRAFASQVRQARPTLLVVAEDDTGRALLAPALRFLGYDPVIARNSNYVLSQLAEARPEAILMDTAASVTDSVSLTRQLKAIPDVAHIPIIIVSGDARRDTLISSMRAGASDFIAKPFTREVLRTKLDKLFRSSATA
jgi:CheY-like chemotaxis protein